MEPHCFLKTAGLLADTNLETISTRIRRKTQPMIVTLKILLGLIAVIGLLRGLHRLCLRLDEQGYLYYRTRPQGGSRLGGVLNEVDKLIRPSIEETIEASDDSPKVARPTDDGE